MASLTINGASQTIDAPDETSLLWAIRDLVGLKGTKYGCGIGLCGACVIHVDGVAEYSCMLSLSQVEGAEITTIEGLSEDGNHPVQVAWREINVPQCGFCQAGQIMRAASLIDGKPDITDDEILEGMSGNLCRCGCYQRIVSAVRTAATGS